ncbi:methionyl-tRNA formyltransferase [Chryseobacterium sp.]|uniref:methionyl-tRNA formyltransferase n=1 Tax=Chryseobacterium sp. TaxID=1871047 RepID=UPI001E3438C8|nr:methionyl-tRNA formyltransferase [Chryseobacterium sp.]
MSNYILLTEKSWHKNLFSDLKKTFCNDSWLLIDSKSDFNLKNIKKFNPTKIFIPHWSHIIPREIFESFECIVFHMTDLPFGRGGSPLQNLISRNYKTTKITAIKVEQGLDTGDVYLKKTLGLEGTATEIFERSSSVIEEMIGEIINENIQPLPQFGEITEFKRRKPEDSNICELSDLEKVYDYIRMLDCEGYPHAFIETDHLKFEFINSKFDENKEIITANVRISKK